MTIYKGNNRIISAALMEGFVGLLDGVIRKDPNPLIRGFYRAAGSGTSQANHFKKDREQAQDAVDRHEDSVVNLANQLFARSTQPQQPGPRLPSLPRPSPHVVYAISTIESLQREKPIAEVRFPANDYWNLLTPEEQEDIAAFLQAKNILGRVDPNIPRVWVIYADSSPQLPPHR